MYSLLKLNVLKNTLCERKPIACSLHFYYLFFPQNLPVHNCSKKIVLSLKLFSVEKWSLICGEHPCFVMLTETVQAKN